MLLTIIQNAVDAVKLIVIANYLEVIVRISLSFRRKLSLRKSAAHFAMLDGLSRLKISSRWVL